jgi:hypothetical protein
MYKEFFYQDAENKSCCNAAALTVTFQRAASGQYIEKKIVLSGKTNMRNHMQMTEVS